VAVAVLVHQVPAVAAAAVRVGGSLVPAQSAVQQAQRYDRAQGAGGTAG
jgi:hypothetical protein